jgi:trigger factor
MEVSVEELGACRRRLSIEIPAERVDEVFDTVIGEYARHARVKGFRPGKAPKKVVSARFAKQIAGEVKDRILPEAYRSALAKESLVPVAVVHVEDAAPAARSPFRFAVTCDIAPEFELPTYRNLKLNSEIRDVGDSDVDDAIASLKDRFAQFEDVQRPPRSGDLVQVDFEAFVDGRPLQELAPEAKGLGAATDFWLQAGPEAFLPELGEAVLDAAIGTSVEATVTFPADFGEEALQGRTALYRATVKQVREKQVGNLTEAQLKQLGVDTEDALRARVREDLQTHRASQERRQLRNQAVGLLLDGTAFELPESVVQSETRSTIYEMVQDIARRGTSQEQIQERKEELFDVASQNAAAKVRIRFILARIAEAEKIKVSDEELHARLESMAARSRMSAADLRRELRERNQLDNLEQDLLFEKTLDFIMDQAEVIRACARRRTGAGANAENAGDFYERTGSDIDSHGH